MNIEEILNRLKALPRFDYDSQECEDGQVDEWVAESPFGELVHYYDVEELIRDIEGSR